MLSEKILLTIAQKVAAKMKQKGSRMDFNDLVNEAFVAASEHQKTESLAAFWAYKITSKLAFSTDRKHGKNKSKELEYLKFKKNNTSITSIDNVLDLLSVLNNQDCPILMIERLCLFHHFVENMSINDIAKYYNKDQSTISNRITAAKNKLMILLNK